MKLLAFLLIVSSQIFSADQPATPPSRTVFVLTDDQNVPQAHVSPDQIVAELNGNRTVDFSIAPLKDKALQVCLMIDTSGSSASSRESINRFFKGAEALLRMTIRPNQDSACLVDFSGHASVDQDRTDNVDALATAVTKHFSTHGGTALYDSLAATCQNFDKRDVSAQRRVVILASDGEDNASRKSLAEAVTQCQLRAIIVFTFDVSPRPQFGWCGVVTDARCALPEGIPFLKEIAEKTGGLYFAPRDDESTIKAFKATLASLDALHEIVFSHPPAKAKVTLRVNQSKWVILPKQTALADSVNDRRQ